MDRQQPHRVGSLLLRDRLELARADGLLLGDEADEALDVGAAQLLVRAGEPRELAHVRVAAAPVPLREHREVVVVLADDALAQPLEREPRQRRRQPLEPLAEREQQPLVALRQPGRQRPLEPREQRPLRRGAPQQREPVVGHPDERRREHRQQRAVVVAVLQQAQVAEQVDHLLLAEVAPCRSRGTSAGPACAARPRTSSASVPAANRSTISPGAATPPSTSSRTRRATARASPRRQWHAGVPVASTCR